uniref:ATP synthase F0 subunit 8 n=1 Tax=Oreohelix idahoensis TaxID=2584915 RepID=A0A4Y5P355_9EUPU|nr:ATP synthase F0 subunit 8 [Oreohelix idahoensis]QCW57652.1 ATP synthase F0 subunit 8 [Oreohelix idahoensis]UKG20814.1 ATP synthase F0 subunit 8 [Oreohelix idahoensis]
MPQLSPASGTLLLFLSVVTIMLLYINCYTPKLNITKDKKKFINKKYMFYY